VKTNFQSKPLALEINFALKLFDETVVLAARQFVYVSQWFIIVAVVCHQKTK